uniref:Uncharacterized protein n=1 Tax=Arundo donax TaxID=35708 RepID=A0A0A9APK1_ARUDO
MLAYMPSLSLFLLSSFLNCDQSIYACPPTAYRGHPASALTRTNYT